MKPELDLAPGTDLVEWLLSLPPERRLEAIALLGEAERDSLDRAWPEWAHEGQRAPPGDWRTWVIMAGRGFGKTLAGAQWVTEAVARSRTAAGAPSSPPLRIALVGATLDEARRIMVEGRSGLLEVADAWVADWNPSLRRLAFRTGAEAILFSGASPEQLRGPEHHLAWCDELAKWEKPKESWAMLQLGLRLGDRPRALVTTTPRPGPVLKGIMAEPDTVVTGGPTRVNPHLAEAWKRAVEALYAGTRLGRQELEGELLADTPGALWWPELLERCRIESSPAFAGGEERRLSGGQASTGGRSLGNHAKHGGGAPPPHFVRSPSPRNRGEDRIGFTRLVVAVDPPAGDGTCGIIACARDEAGHAHVVADHSVAGRTPEGWARAVADAARLWSHPTILSLSKDAGPATIVAEQNQGGKMVAAVLHTADPSLRVKLVTATAGKTTRAEPVAQLFEAGRATLHGRFPELEAELCGMIAGGDYEGPGNSPDRADAMVWGLTELMLGRERAEPRVRLL